MSFGAGTQPPTRRLTCDETEDLLGAFVLDSLEPADEARVRAHLASCPECRKEEAALRAVVMSIGESVTELTPPPGLRERILAQARNESPARLGPGRSGESGSPAARWRRSGWSPWVATAAAALLALSAGSWGLIEHFSGSSRATVMTSAPLAPVEQLLAGGHAKVISLSPSHHSRARGVLLTNPTTGATYLLVTSLPALHSPRIYALWYTVLKSGTLTQVRIGQAERPGAYRLNVGPRGVATVALTREPEPGDSTPRGPVLLAASLS